MMIMISTSPPSAVHLTAEEANLFDLWHACGLGVVLEKAGSIDPILLFLRYGAEPKHGFAYSLGHPYFALVKRGLCQSAMRNLSRGDACSFVWIYRNMPYQTVLRLLRATLGSECEQPQYIPCMYDAGHPSFAANEAKWDRYCTMLALEGFPVHLSYALTRAVDWLSSYETLNDRFADHPLLPKMRQSLLRLGNRGHHDLFEAFGHRPSKMVPRTAGARKYMSVKGLERLAMMRHHAYRSKDTD